MTIKSILLIPIHLNALLLRSDQPVVAAAADFTRLLYFDKTRDVNPDIPYLSESVVSHPFQDQHLYLKAGIHLDWALPDALTKGAQTSAGTSFPAVPNRWLVTRSIKGDGDRQVFQKTWIVESDYLHPDGAGSQSGAVSYPFPPDPDKRKYQPFRCLGRKMPLDDWQAHDASAEYLKTLTAVGYGEPTFAAFYPNCHSVFGFYDGDYVEELPTGLQYDVVGWSSDGNQDHL